MSNDSNIIGRASRFLKAPHAKNKLTTVSILVVICLVLAIALLQTMTFTEGARMLPLVVGIPTAILAVYALIKEIAKQVAEPVSTHTCDTTVVSADEQIGASVKKVLLI